tara:strand:+ start:3424 stop:4269 length:846 start_codon:yes stop_codon:yes gene_type:complete
MTSISVVTTFHPEGMQKYGQRFLDSFANMVDKNINMLVYAENCNPRNKDPEQIKIINAKEITKLNAFKERWGNVPKANGTPPDDIKARRPRDWHKAFKWDAVRFANKVYAVFHAAETCGTDWLVWMDADTFVHSNWSYKQFAKLLPNDKWLTYVGRGKGSQTWPECGFYGMNLKHPMCKQFLKEFERFYEDADNGIFELEEWHDSFVFGHILNQLTPIDSNVLDYSADMYIKSAKTGGGGHPLINTELGTWIDHMKGARKDKGKSLSKDIIVNRKEAYWNG